MKRTIPTVLLLLFWSLALAPHSWAQKSSDLPVRVYFLGGQSNMNGFGYVKELPDTLDFSNIWIYQGNPADDGRPNGGVGLWEELRPGHGIGFRSDGTNNYPSDRFGVELSFAHRLKQLYPGEKIALIKYAKSGSSIDSAAARQFGSWEPDFQGKGGLNQYDFFLRTVHAALKVEDVDGDGKKDQLMPAGILWMQGESDALTEEVASRYYYNLKRMMDLIRTAFHTDDLPVAIGKISDSFNDEDGLVWDYGDLVQHAQEKYARSDQKAGIVRSTKYYQYSDPYHYNSAGYLDLGWQFANKISEIENK